MAVEEQFRADAVFEGGGVKGIAFAGAIASAERDGGVKEWVNLAGTSAGAIVAGLLAAGCMAADLKRILDAAEYPRFADCGFGGMWVGGVRNAIFRMRGLAPGDYFETWFNGCLAESPLGKKKIAADGASAVVTFGDLKRNDLPPMAELPGITAEKYEQATYRLHVIASDVTGGRMLVLPDDLPLFEDENGKPIDKDSFPIVKAVRMSMSFPFLFKPVVLKSGGKDYFIVDGGLLSNFPIWLFDSPNPRRPTWGFRLHGGASVKEGLPYRKVPRPLWEVPLLKAMFSSSMEAWDRHQMEQFASSTVSIPTHNIATTDFGIGKTDADHLYTWGFDAAHAFFTAAARQSYINSFGKGVEGALPIADRAQAPPTSAPTQGRSEG